MQTPNHSTAASSFNLNELQLFLLGSFREHQTGSLAALVEQLRNTTETPRTLQPPRSQLQMVQQQLQAQYEATPIDAVPTGEPTRQQLSRMIRAITCYEHQSSAQSQRLILEAEQATLEAQQALHVNQPANLSMLSILANHRNRSTAPITQTQQRSACHAAGLLRPLLARHSVFTASPEQRNNLLLHFHTLINSELQPSFPLNLSDLALFFNQRDDSGGNSRLNYLQIMTASLRGSPNAAIVSQINALLSETLTDNISFEQVLVPQAPAHLSEAALLGVLNNLTPNAQQLFLLKWSRAILQICQLVTREIAQIRTPAQTSPPPSSPTSPSSPSLPSSPISSFTSAQQPLSPPVTPVPRADRAQSPTPTQKIIAECRQKLEQACGYDGVLREFERRSVEMSAFECNRVSAVQFARLVDEGKKLLNELNHHMPIILLEDASLAEQIHSAFALVLNTMLLGDIFSKINRKDQKLPSSSVKFTYYRSILAFLQHSAHPWDIDAIYKQVKDIFN
ncbi:MAG: hypothetical protein ACRC9R_05645, partial [Enterovibrio sp.]